MLGAGLMNEQRRRHEVRELAEARSRGEIDDNRWFTSMAVRRPTSPATIRVRSRVSAATRPAGRQHGGRLRRRSIRTARSSTSAARRATCSSRSFAGPRTASSGSGWSSHPCSPRSRAAGSQSGPTGSSSATRSPGSRRSGSISSAPSSCTCPPSGGSHSSVICSATSSPQAGGSSSVDTAAPASAVPADPVHAIVLSHGLKTELALGVAAPEGGGAILELAVLRAG
jgi:hypothetical protein